MVGQTVGPGKLRSHLGSGEQISFIRFKPLAKRQGKKKTLPMSSLSYSCPKCARLCVKYSESPLFDDCLNRPGALFDDCLNRPGALFDDCLNRLSAELAKNGPGQPLNNGEPFARFRS